MATLEKCPECGCTLPEDALGGLCPQCLLQLAVDEVDGGEDLRLAPTLVGQGTNDPLRVGAVLGKRYRLLAMLGRGGMGEVWRAFDLRLRVEMALKALRRGLLADDHAAEALRGEVRAARQVISPNVCRVFDLVEVDGLEMVAMEFVAGTTLSEVLRGQGPLEPNTAGEIASQLLAGLDAIHGAGFVHRDVKPENLMVTATGRVVVMDFGLAHKVDEGADGSTSGTPAYMAPEQARGLPLDVRADIFAVGVVLAEMLAAGGIGRPEARLELWQALHDDPPRVPPGPWREVIRRAVARAPADRFPSAVALARALEDIAVGGRTTGERTPYPGLAAFSQDDAEYFFGRELEVETLLRSLKRPRLRAVIGPSGAGKSSFLLAGLVPALPESWSTLVCTPGDRPFVSMARALARELAGDPEAVGRLLEFDNVPVAVSLMARWRARHGQALLIVDQFEELFTLHSEEVQARFAELLRALVLEADVHVMLAMRDDFLLRCQAHEPLRALFDGLTPLGPPAGPALRRAVVQPALRAGYRFDDERLVDDMLAEVADARGALPLLAFAAAALWERRDRERGLLTRSAYEEIGGVGGALALHAESTLERIGSVREPVVRELFRHLVTAAGTRVVQDRAELLSAVAHRSAAADVLQHLVEARLLTSFDVPNEIGGAGHRIEIIHESLVTAWPRLVRWRAEDAEGARLRDQLRQAAKLWEDKGRPPDLLWTGSSYQEFQLWRERQPGRLPGTEEAFARAMETQAGRRRRHAQLALALLVAALLGVSGVIAYFWRQAVHEARRAEAQQAYTLGQVELERDPTTALAFAIASLEQADTPHARRLALAALWRGPTAFALGSTSQIGPETQFEFSPDGRWLASVEQASGTVRLRESGGAEPRILVGSGGWPWLGFTSDSRHLVVTQAEVLRVYSLPAAVLTRKVEESFRWGFVRGQELFSGHLLDPAPDGRWRRLHKVRRLPDGEPETLGIMTSPERSGFSVDPAGRSYFFSRGNEIHEFPLREPEAAPRLVYRVDSLASWFVSPDGERLYTWDESGAGAIWSRASGERMPGPRVDFSSGSRPSSPAASADGRWLAAVVGDSGEIRLWELEGAEGGEPLVLLTDDRVVAATFHPDGGWLATRDNQEIKLWPLTDAHPRTLRGGGSLAGVAFDPEGAWIVATGRDGSLSTWSLRPGIAPPEAREVTDGGLSAVELSPRRDVAALSSGRGVWLAPIPDGPVEHLAGFEGVIGGIAFDGEGRRLAAGGVGNPFPPEKVIRVWDLDTREHRVLDAGRASPFTSVAFLPSGRLLSAGGDGLLSWDLETGEHELLAEGVMFARPSPDGQRAVVLLGTPGPGGLVGAAGVYDLVERKLEVLARHGEHVTFADWGPDGRLIATASRDGVVRVGAPTGEEPHLLLGHLGTVNRLDFDSEGSWIASAGEDGTVRLWPVPGDDPPLHTLPHEQLLDLLRGLTNYRIHEDPSSAGGYRVGFEPSQGWGRTPPTWLDRPAKTPP